MNNGCTGLMGIWTSEREFIPTLALLLMWSLALELNCLVLGNDCSHIFKIKFQGNKNISAVKQSRRRRNLFLTTFQLMLSISSRIPFLWMMALTPCWHAFIPKIKGIIVIYHLLWNN
jgi:hypothetical protein